MMNIRGLFLKGMVVIMLTTALTACVNTNASKPKDISESFYNDSVKIVKNTEQRMQKSMSESRQDQVEFDMYYAKYLPVIDGKAGTKREQELILNVISVYIGAKEYFKYFDDQEQRATAMVRYLKNLNTLKEVFILK